MKMTGTGDMVSGIGMEIRTGDTRHKEIVNTTDVQHFVIFYTVCVASLFPLMVFTFGVGHYLKLYLYNGE